MSRGRDKGRIEGQFVPVRYEVLDCPAWKAMSPGARCLYIALRRRVPKGRNRVFLSHRNAVKEIGCAKASVGRWFDELEHYGFVVLLQHGCLGVDGKGKSPHWRLTELGQTSKTSADGLLDPPTRDFLRWDGVKFQKTKSRPTGEDTLSYSVAHPCPTDEDTNCGNCPTEQAIGNAPKCPTEQAISSNHIQGNGGVPSSTLKTDGRSTVGPFADAKIAALGNWGRAAQKKPWTKPTILSDEPRDFAEFPIERRGAA